MPHDFWGWVRKGQAVSTWFSDSGGSQGSSEMPDYTENVVLYRLHVSALVNSPDWVPSQQPVWTASHAAEPSYRSNPAKTSDEGRPKQHLMAIAWETPSESYPIEPLWTFSHKLWEKLNYCFKLQSFGVSSFTATKHRIPLCVTDS